MNRDKNVSVSRCPVQKLRNVFGGGSKYSFHQVQGKVNEVILSVGGYFPVLAGVARLVEEIGELSELLREEPDVDELASELADVFIISACIANQYCLTLTTYKSPVKVESQLPISPQSSIITMIEAAGLVSRAANYYEGFKPLKRNEVAQSVQLPLNTIVSELSRLAIVSRLDLITIVEEKITKIASRDQDRFEAKFDPSTAEALVSFDAVVRNTLCPFARAARMWGTLDYSQANTTAENAIRLTNDLAKFARVARVESLDALVVRVPSSVASTADEFGLFFGSLLRQVSISGGSEPNLFERVETEEWRLKLCDEEFFIATFLPYYDEVHARFSESADWCFIVFQPLHSFNRKDSLSKLNRRKTVARIRSAFLAAGRGYAHEWLEAARFIKPVSISGSIIDWWKSIEK
jgi:hypothetical protein